MASLLRLTALRELNLTDGLELTPGRLTQLATLLTLHSLLRAPSTWRGARASSHHTPLLVFKDLVNGRQRNPRASTPSTPPAMVTPFITHSPCHSWPL